MLANRVRMGARSCSEHDDRWTDIGSLDLAFGSMAAGFFGEVSSDDLITGNSLRTLVGISEGTAQNSASGWLKFAWMGNIQFVAKRPIRYSISWDAINAASCARGAVREETIQGYTFKVRLLKGSGVAGDSTIPDYPRAAEGALNHGSEWNRLMLPIHRDAKAGGGWGGNHSDNVGELDVPDRWWGVDNPNGYTDADLYVGGQNGSRAWCQESALATVRRLCRGRLSGAYSSVHTSNSNTDDYGWRPVLELVI